MAVIKETKKIRDCSYWELKNYLDKNPSSYKVRVVLAAFRAVWIKSESSWRLAIGDSSSGLASLIRSEVLDSKVTIEHKTKKEEE